MSVLSARQLAPEVLDRLRRRSAGAVIAPGDAGYDEARTVWNAMIDRRPCAVIRAAGPDDVLSAIDAARDHRLDLAIRGGGHNVAGQGTVDAGIVLDLGQMNSVSVDPDSATVRVEGGATLADVDAATQPYGLAVPLGVVSATGVAGLTLGGGLGWLTRAHGLTADNLLSAEIVTAGGERLTAGPEEHADLFWALRGGGGNFGVVTAFTFRAHQHGPQVFSGNLVYGQDRWPAAWAGWERWTRDLPEEMTSTTTTLTPPAAMQMGDDPLLVVGFVWASPDREAGEAVLEGLREMAPPDVEQVGEHGWLEWQSVLDGLVPKGVRAYWRNASFNRLDEEVVDLLVRRGREQTWTGTAFDVHHLGGAFGRVPEDATAFPDRSSRFWINIYGFWDDAAADDDRVAFIRGLSGDMDRFATGGQYLNFQGEEPSGHRAVDPRTVFGPSKFERLVEVKRRYDPANLFHINHNIVPGSAPSSREGWRMLEHTNLDGGAESVQEFQHGHIAWGTVGGYTAWRLTARPGWRYSEHLGPLEGVTSCPEDHMLFIVSGRMRTRMDSGEELENGPGVAVRIPAGHDAWTVGEDTLVVLGVDPR